MHLAMGESNERDIRHRKRSEHLVEKDFEYHGLLTRSYKGQLVLLILLTTIKVSQGKNCPSLGDPHPASLFCSVDADIPKKECTASCPDGQTFPNGQKEITLSCDSNTGEWKPLPKFPSCQKNESDPFEYEDLEESPLSESCSSLEGPIPGSVSCTGGNCTAKCRPGDSFPDGSTEMVLTCKSGEWYPLADFPSCKRHPCSLITKPRNGDYKCSYGDIKAKCRGFCLEMNETFPDGTKEKIIECDYDPRGWYPISSFPNCVETSEEIEEIKKSTEVKKEEKVGDDKQEQKGNCRLLKIIVQVSTEV